VSNRSTLFRPGVKSTAPVGMSAESAGSRAHYGNCKMSNTDISLVLVGLLVGRALIPPAAWLAHGGARHACNRRTYPGPPQTISQDEGRHATRQRWRRLPGLGPQVGSKGATKGAAAGRRVPTWHQRTRRASASIRRNGAPPKHRDTAPLGVDYPWPVLGLSSLFLMSVSRALHRKGGGSDSPPSSREGVDIAFWSDTRARKPLWTPAASPVEMGGGSS
jgi:hypothetical protein